MNTMRDALNVVRYDWFGVRIGGRGASMRGLWPVLSIVSVLIFCCFFVVGRMTSGGAPAPETSSSQRVAHAAIPGGLHGSSPVAGDVPSAIATPPARHAPTPAAVVETPASQPLAGAAASAPSVVSTPAPTPVPAQASAPPTKSSGPGAAGGSGAGGGGSGGGSFDSSG